MKHSEFIVNCHKRGNTDDTVSKQARFVLLKTGKKVMLLTNEIEAYENLRSGLELDHFGEWVVLHDERLIAKYPSFEAAAEDAIQRFGRGPYLIRQIGQAPLTLPASVSFGV